MSKLFSLAAGILSDSTEVTELKVTAHSINCTVGGESFAVEQADKGFYLFDRTGRKMCASIASVRAGMRIADKSSKQQAPKEPKAPNQSKAPKEPKAKKDPVVSENENENDVDDGDNG